MALVVGADRGKNERGRVGRRVLPIDNDEPRVAVDEYHATAARPPAGVADTSTIVITPRPTLLQIFSVTLFEKMPMTQAFSESTTTFEDGEVSNQLNLFDY